jgi:hypothetical protein
MRKKIGCIQHDCAVCEARAKRVNGQPEMVYVEWIDSCTTSGWCGDEQIENAGNSLHCRTVGFLVKETDSAIVLALNNAYGDRVRCPFGDLMTIPKIAITLRAGIEAHYLPKHAPEEGVSR